MALAENSLFQFEEYRLRRFHFKEARQHQGPEAIHFNIGIETAAEALQRVESGGAEKRSTLVGLKIWVEWQPSPGPFVLEIEGEGVFQSSLDMSADQYRDLCEIHGPALLYTQFRPLTRMIASEAGETFMLPLINIGETVRRSRAKALLPAGSSP